MNGRHSPAILLPACFLLLSWFAPGLRAEPPPDPVPLRRIELTPAQVLAEMKRTGQGRLLQLPRAEFEDLLRRAAAAAESRKPPRLLETRYSARLTNAGSLPAGNGAVEAHLEGSARWKLLNSGGPGAALLPLPHFNLAVKQPRLGKGEAPLRDALLGDLDGKNFALLVDQPGEQTLALDWSARGEVGPGGLHFDLETPACPVALLELDLPAGMVVNVSSEGCLLSGPGPAATEDRRLWTVRFAGKTKINLQVHREGAPGQAPAAVLAGLQSVQYLSFEPSRPGGDAEFAFQLDGPGLSALRQLVCEYDPALRPFDVTVANLEGWEPHPPAPGKNAATLTVRLGKPLQSGALVVRCLAPLGGPAGTRPGTIAWTSPWMRVVGAAPRGETLTLRLHRDLSLEDWRPGAFRLKSGRTDSDGLQELTLIGGGVEGDHPRPGAQIRISGADFRARQLLWWQVDAAPPLLQAQVEYEVLHGQLPQLALALPPGWEPERLDLQPAELLRTWNVRREAGQRSLIVDLNHSLMPGARPAGTGKGSGAVLNVWLRPPPGPASRGTTAGVPYQFPEVVPLGAHWREGALAIKYDERRSTAVVTTTAVAGHPEERAPWGQDVPNYYFPYRNEPLTGTLRLVPRRPQVSSRCTTEVVLTRGRAALVVHLQLQPEVGQPEALDLGLSAPSGPWEWKTRKGSNAVRRFERLRAVEAAGLLAPLAAGSTPAAAGLLLAPPGKGERWRLTLARPLTEALTLEGSCEIPRAAGGAEAGGQLHVEAPLPGVLGAGQQVGEVKLYLSGANPIQVETSGLQEMSTQRAADRQAGGVSPWRLFRCGQPPLALVLRGQAVAPEPVAETVVENAHLITTVEPGGGLLQTYRFRVWNWPQRTLPLPLPAGARPLAVRVDGRWLRQLPPAHEFPAEGGEAATAELPLPVPAGAALHAYEISYALPRPAWTVWTRLDAPAPHLPVQPLAFRRTWRLPPGVVPLLDEGEQRLPGPGATTAGPLLPFPGWAGWDRSGRWPALAEDPARQRQLLAEAGNLSAGRPLLLGQALDLLVFERLHDRLPLVLDAPALRKAGLGPDSPIPAPQGKATVPFWETLDPPLVHVPCRAAALLTTARQQQGWEAGTPPSVEEAVAEAVRYGHDSTGRFCTAAHWLRREAPLRPLPSAAEAGPGAADPGVTWTDWEPVAGTGREDNLLVVRQDSLPLAGLILTAFFAAALWRAGRAGRRARLYVLLVWLAVAALGWLWLPSSLRSLAAIPLLVGGAVALGWYLYAAGTHKKGPPPEPSGTPSKPAEAPTGRPAGGSTGSKRVVTAGIAFLLLSLSLWSAPPEPATVYLLPVPDGRPDKQDVLIAPELQKDLEALARQGVGGLRGPVLLAADYEGQVTGTTAEFEATFQVHAFTPEAATLALPLDKVKLLGEPFLDGVPVLPALAPAAQGGGYLVPIKARDKGKGQDSPPLVLRVRFRVPVQAQGEERELQFAVPRLAQNRLKLTVPAGSSYLQALVKQGAQQVQATDKGVELAVDLGRVGAPLSFRWRQPEGAPRPPAVTVREGYLWELTPLAGNLTARLRYSVSKGSASLLALDLPEALEVREVETGLVGIETAGRRLLREWWVDGAGPQRRLHLEFTAPVAGDVDVKLDLLPNRPFRNGALLPLPAPRDVERTEGHVCLMPQGWRVRIDPFRGAVADSKRTAEFLAFWKSAGGGTLRIDPLRDYVWFFDRRNDERHPVLGLQNLTPEPAPLQVTQDLAWRLGPRQADLHATLNVRSRTDPPALVEWQIPASVTVVQVTGPDVRSWNRSGSRLQVWLQRSAERTELRLTGWARVEEVKPANPAAGGTGAGSFELPALRPPAAAEPVTWLRLTAGSGEALTRLRSHHLAAAPSPQPGGRSEPELVYVALDSDYGGTFGVRPAGARADVRVLTFAEVRDRQLTFTATVLARARQGELRALTVRLRNWDGPEVRIDGGKTARPLSAQGPAAHGWLVELPPGDRGAARLTVSGSMSVEDAGGGVRMPDVAIDEALRSERLLAVAGQELSGEDAFGLSAVAEPGAVLRPWPREAERLRRSGGSVWKVGAGDWGLRLLPRYRVAEAAGVQVFLTEHAAAVVDGRSWVHQATYWLYHEASTDLNVTLPEGARAQTVTVNGVGIAPLQKGTSLWLPLPGGAGVRRVRLRWLFAEGTEALDRPRLDRPRLDGVPDSPTLWTVHVPAGYSRGGSEVATEDVARPVGGVALDLARAEAQLRLSAFLAERPRGRGETDQLLAAQQRFYLYCRYARHALALLEQQGRPAEGAQGPRGQTLAEWLEELDASDVRLARTQGFEKLQDDARQQVAPGQVSMPVLQMAGGGDAGDVSGSLTTGGAEAQADSLPERGLPLSWQGGAEQEMPALHLVTLSGRQSQRSAAGSLLVLLLVLLAWLLARSPGVLGWLRVLWPEQMVLLGCLAWQALGLNLVVVFLLALGICGRLVALLWWGAAFFRRKPA
jgi:hypothetical protein